MNTIISTIRRLPEMEHSVPASADDIRQAERELNLFFAEEYKAYLSAFGAAWSDIIALSGIIDDEEYSVVELTKAVKAIVPNVPKDFYVIEDVGVDGLVIWQNVTGAVYQSVPNCPPVKIFDSLSDFLAHQMDG